MIVHGGVQGTTPLADVWAASLNAPYAWSLLAPTGLAPEARVEHAAAYDPLRDRMILFGGRAFGWKGDLWALDFRGTGVPGSPSSALGLALHRTWHSPNALHLDLTAAAGRARIELMDVAGRRVLARTVDLSSAARHRLAVPFCNVARGLYFVRVSQGIVRAGGRVVVVER